MASRRDLQFLILLPHSDILFGTYWVTDDSDVTFALSTLYSENR